MNYFNNSARKISNKNFKITSAGKQMRSTCKGIDTKKKEVQVYRHLDKTFIK